MKWVTFDMMGVVFEVPMTSMSFWFLSSKKEIVQLTLRKSMNFTEKRVSDRLAPMISGANWALRVSIPILKRTTLMVA